MRWAEAGLFLAPFLLYAAWRLSSVYAKPSLVWGAGFAVLLLVAITVWLGLTRKIDRGEAYVPAHVEDGRVVPGHAASRTGP